MNIICLLLLSLGAAAQTGGEKLALPTAPVPQHHFWDRTNVLLFSGVAVVRGLDYASTRNFQARGRDEILVPDDVVNNSAGFAGLRRRRAPLLLVFRIFFIGLDITSWSGGCRLGTLV